MADILTFVSPLFFWDKLSVTFSFYRNTIAKVVGDLYNFGLEVIEKTTIN